MEHLLAGAGITLTYLQDHRAIAEIEWPVILDDLTDAGAPPNRCHWCDLDGLTHVVIAKDRATGRHAGVLGLAERATPGERFLMIEAAMLRPGAASAELLRAMVAHALTRSVCLDGKPAAIAAPGADRSTEPTLRGMGPKIAAAELYPPSTGNVIGLRTARLARQIGEVSAVLDFRAVAEASLLRDLKRLHRIRRTPAKAAPGKTLQAAAAPKKGPCGKSPSGKPPITSSPGKGATGKSSAGKIAGHQRVMAKPARSGDARHHPRTATRTGMSG